MIVNLESLSSLLNVEKYSESRLYGLFRRVIYQRPFGSEHQNLAARLIDGYLSVIRSRQKIHRRWHRISALRLEIDALDSICMWTPTSDPLSEGLKQILLLVERGNIEEIKAIAQKMQDVRKNEISERQRLIAKKPRPNPFSIILDELVDINPNITTSETIEELKKLEGRGVIYQITDTTIEVDVTEPSFSKSIKISRLPDLLYQAKQRRKSRSF